MWFGKFYCGMGHDAASDPLTSSWPAEKWVDDEKTRKITKKNVRWPTNGRNTCPEASTSGFRDSPGPPLSVDALGYVPVHRQGQQNGRQVWYFFVFFNGIQTRRPSGGIRSEYLPDRGVQWLHVKPWTPSIGRYRQCRAVALARASKRLRRRCICSSSTIAQST